MLGVGLVVGIIVIAVFATARQKAKKREGLYALETLFRGRSRVDEEASTITGTIDGQSVGQTPIVNRSISAGSHRITCTNPDLGVTRNLNVDVAPGQPTRQRINLQ